MAMPLISDKPIIGFVGLGSIGAPMATRLLGFGSPLFVFDKMSEKSARFSDQAGIVTSGCELANQADVVFSCLTTRQTCIDALLAPDGVIHGRRVRIYVHTGTNDATFLRELDAAFGERGIGVLDAPMTGGVARACDGTLTVMAAGPSPIFRCIEPLLRLYANKIIYLGERVGPAQQMKLINNMMSCTNLAVACEAIVMAHKSGINLNAALDVLNSGTGRNSATATKIPQQVFTRAFALGGTLDVALKDLSGYLKEAKDVGAPTVISSVVLEIFRRAMDEEGGQADVTTVARFFERAAGTVLPKA